VAIAGGGLHYAAIQKTRSVDRESRARCGAGCDSEPADLAAERAEASTMQKVAMGAYVAGGAALLVGGVLAYMNHAESYVRPYDADAPAEPPRQAKLEIAPVLDPARAGVSVTARF
jgi:hypothetical protein